MKPIIRVENLSKQYTIGRREAAYATLRESLNKAACAPLAVLRRGLRTGGKYPQPERFWALKDVSFNVMPGEVIGVIGRNGAGKSTLLKILSRITEPTKGQVDLYGRVGSLLEVGTGFHPELTGRENIYLNGAILGMRRNEIRTQFQEIVEFAEVEKFIDTPVKHYSSGMYLRLAFAVAAHLRPEILLVDEVLAVGDAAFQSKCLRKMSEISERGRTVIFVSHNLQAVVLLCNQAIALHEGNVIHSGDVRATVDAYLHGSGQSRDGYTPCNRRPGSGELRFTSVRPKKAVFDPCEEKVFHFRIERRRESVSAHVSAHVVDQWGGVLLQCDSTLLGFTIGQDDFFEGTFQIKNPWLKPGRYRLDVFICASHMIDRFEDSCSFDVSNVIPYPFCSSADATGEGTVFADFSWTKH